MKRISTRDMSATDQYRLHGNMVGAMGNRNILGCHIEYFERRIIEERENLRDSVSFTPNYYAWLWLMTEHVFWDMRTCCFVEDELNEENLDSGYNYLVTRFCEVCRCLNLWPENKLRNLYDLACKVLIVRHAMVHKGFPSVLPATLRNERRKPKFAKTEESSKFTEDTIREVIAWYRDPRNFDEVKKECLRLIEAMGQCPGLTVDFGTSAVSCGHSGK